MQEVQGKLDTYDASVSFKEFMNPVSVKHSAGLGKKIQDFKEKHAEADVGPQSLITLSTEQTQELKAEVATGVTGNWVCQLARGPIQMAASAYCGMVFGWAMNMFDVWACFISFTIPFESVC